MYFSFKFNFGNDPTVSAPTKVCVANRLIQGRMKASCRWPGKYTDYEGYPKTIKFLNMPGILFGGKIQHFFYFFLFFIFYFILFYFIITLGIQLQYSFTTYLFAYATYLH